MIWSVCSPTFGPNALAGAPPSPTPAVSAGGGTRWIVAVMSGTDRRGRWRIGAKCNVVNVMGGSDIDLNDAELSAPVTRITVFSLMGGCEIRVPDGVEVHVSSIPIMGGNDVKLGDQVPPTGAPEIHIRLISIMGGAAVKRGRKGARKRLKSSSSDR